MMTEKLGPVQLVAIAFAPEANFESRIMDELSRLERNEAIRILDQEETDPRDLKTWW